MTYEAVEKAPWTLLGRNILAESEQYKAARGVAVHNLSDGGRGSGRPEVLERCVAHSFLPGCGEAAESNADGGGIIE